MRVNLDAEFLADPRFRRLAKRLRELVDLGDPIELANLVEDAARWRTIAVWFACYGRRSATLDAVEVDLAARTDGFASAMVESHLADLIPSERLRSARAEPKRTLSERSSGSDEVRVRGVERRIAYLIEQSERGRRGGLSTTAPPEGRSENESSRQPRRQANAKRTLPAPEANASAPLKPTSRSSSGSSSGSEIPEESARGARGSFGEERAGLNQPSWLASDDPPAVGEVAEAPPEPAASRRRPGKRAAAPSPGSEIEPGSSASGEPPEIGGASAGHPELKASIDGYHALHRERRGAPPTWGGRTVATLNRWLTEHRVDSAELLRRAEIMFASAPRWPVEHGGDLATLLAHFDKFAAASTAAPARAGKRTALEVALAIANGEEPLR